MASTTSFRTYGDRQTAMNLKYLSDRLLDRVKQEMSWNNIPHLKRSFLVQPCALSPLGAEVVISSCYGVNNIHVYVPLVTHQPEKAQPETIEKVFLHLKITPQTENERIPYSLVWDIENNAFPSLEFGITEIVPTNSLGAFTAKTKADSEDMFDGFNENLLHFKLQWDDTLHTWMVPQLESYVPRGYLPAFGYTVVALAGETETVYNDFGDESAGFIDWGTRIISDVISGENRTTVTASTPYSDTDTDPTLLNMDDSVSAYSMSAPGLTVDDVPLLVEFTTYKTAYETVGGSTRRRQIAYRAGNESFDQAHYKRAAYLFADLLLSLSTGTSTIKFPILPTFTVNAKNCDLDLNFHVKNETICSEKTENLQFSIGTLPGDGSDVHIPTNLTPGDTSLAYYREAFGSSDTEHFQGTTQWSFDFITPLGSIGVISSDDAITDLRRIWNCDLRDASIESDFYTWVSDAYKYTAFFGRPSYTGAYGQKAQAQVYIYDYATYECTNLPAQNQSTLYPVFNFGSSTKPTQGSITGNGGTFTHGTHQLLIGAAASLKPRSDPRTLERNAELEQAVRDLFNKYYLENSLDLTTVDEDYKVELELRTLTKERE